MRSSAQQIALLKESVWANQVFNHCCWLCILHRVLHACCIHLISCVPDLLWRSSNRCRLCGKATESFAVSNETQRTEGEQGGQWSGVHWCICMHDVCHTSLNYMLIHQFYTCMWCGLNNPQVPRWEFLSRFDDSDKPSESIKESEASVSCLGFVMWLLCFQQKIKSSGRRTGQCVLPCWVFCHFCRSTASWHRIEGLL